MRTITTLVLLLSACGIQEHQELYLEEYLKQNPLPNIIGVLGDEPSCWTVDGENGRYLALTPLMGREGVFMAAEECSRLGAEIFP